MEEPRLLGTVECAADGTISGGLLASDQGSQVYHCLVRTEKDTLIAMINSKHCKWCKGTNAAHGSGGFNSKRYLRLLFQKLNTSKALDVTNFIVDLLDAQPDTDDSPSDRVTYTEPFCKILNVQHISGPSMNALVELDKDFVWGYNLSFSPLGQ